MSEPIVITEEFRDKVLHFMCTAFPGKVFETVPGDSGLILVDGLQLGLDNLLRKYNLSDKSEETLRELTVEHLTLVSANGISSPSLPASFEQARDRILIQILSPAIAKNSAQLRKHIVADLFAGIVMDEDNTFSYVNEEAQKKWGKSLDDLYAVGLNNLDMRSKGLKITQFTNLDTTLMAIAANDGYDAARILLPGLRKVIGQHLGTPFYFGIPNRDFLICWAQTGRSTWQEVLAEKLESDFSEQPYPLSPMMYQVGADGAIALAEPAQ